MIRNRLIPEIQKAFAGREMLIDRDSNPIVRFPCVQSEVGDVAIYDDGDEATVSIEKITHGHFNPYDESLSEDERERIITEDVVDFLEALFQDRILLYVSANKRMGGWIRLDLKAGPVELSHQHRYYLWSRPYK